MARTKSTRHWKVRNQIDTIEKLEAKLKYGINNRDQIYSLPNIISLSFFNSFIFLFVSSSLSFCVLSSSKQKQSIAKLPATTHHQKTQTATQATTTTPSENPIYQPSHHHYPIKNPINHPSHHHHPIRKSNPPPPPSENSMHQPPLENPSHHPPP